MFSCAIFGRCQRVNSVSFEQFSLDARIMSGVKAAGYSVPTPIQQKSIPVTMAGGDVMGIAQTGTGKTAAFLLPILDRLTRGPLRRTRALIIAPTRELAEQIREECEKLAKRTKIRAISVYGGVGKNPQVKALRSGAEIVVACPGRLLDLMNEGHVDLRAVEVLVLDEADRMFDMGFLPDIKRIINKLPRNRQSLFFSATMPKEIRALADDYLDHPETVQIGIIAPAKTVTQALFAVPAEKRKDLLFELLPTLDSDQVLIFTRTKYRARNLARDLERAGYRASALQGNMSQNQRQKAIDGFKSGKIDILAATDIAARGIDVSNITHVINFDIPDTVDAYTHRIGRTGRAKRNGEAFTFVVPDDRNMVRDIERMLNITIERRALEGFEYGSFDPFAQLVPDGKSPKPNSRGRGQKRNINNNSGGRSRAGGGGGRGSNQSRNSSNSSNGGNGGRGRRRGQRSRSTA